MYAVATVAEAEVQMRWLKSRIPYYRTIHPIPVELTQQDLELQLFKGYLDSDTAIISEFARHDQKPEAGFIVDFLGVRTRATSLWPDARALAGNVIKAPVPGDFHAETIEWLGLLKSVKAARDKYVAIELGAGFGPWAIAGGTAARSRGIRTIKLYAVEGDPQHFRFLRQHFEDNGFNPNEHVLLEAVVGVEAGVAQWPLMEDTSAEWGSRPILEDGDYLGRTFESTQNVTVIPMADLIRREQHWDLVHIDVQGHEVEICRSCLNDLNERVSWIVVGTHSRKLDGDMLELLCRADWELEHEKPTKFRYYRNPKTLEGMTLADGTQVWKNPRFA
jgi:FkbM family methyltransferase